MKLEEIYDLWKEEFGEESITFAEYTVAFNAGKRHALKDAVEIAQRLERLPYNSTQISCLLKERIAELETFIKNIHDNYDCDADSHKYNNGFGCRCCDAKKLMGWRSCHSDYSEGGERMSDKHDKCETCIDYATPYWRRPCFICVDANRYVKDTPQAQELRGRWYK